MIKAKSHRILLIDDDPDFNMLLSDAFQFHGFDTCSELSPTKALALLGEQSFDLVITDHNLPGYTSGKVINECRTRAPDLPFVVVSGHLSDTDILTLKDLGVEDIFIKPLDLRKLMECCNALLAKKAS